jgi:hypothetical protein
MSPRRLGVTVACAVLSCHPGAPPPEKPGGGPSTSPPAPVASTDTVSMPPPGSRPTATQPPPVATARDTTPIPVVPRGAQVSVAQLLASGGHTGTVIQVTGRCLGAVPGRAPGPPPSRSAWVLESAGSYIYVVGPFPPGCTLTTAAEAATTFPAQVVEDTFADLRGGARTPRRYLARPR